MITPTVMNSANTNNLLTRCRSGEVDALGEMYDIHSGVVFRYAYRMLGDQEEANDVMQDTFVKAYRNLPGFRGECSLNTWLIRIAANLCRDRVKARIRHGHLSDSNEVLSMLPDESVWGRDPSKRVEDDDMNGLLRRVLFALPTAPREIIVLADLEGMSYNEIAETLGCTVSSVKLRLFRARRLLRSRVESLLEETK